MTNSNTIPYGVSVILCCYNSEQRIKETLSHLLKQQTKYEIPWEIIIVDNCSTDSTAQIARELNAKADRDIDFKIIEEPKSGLSYAREKGITEAKYDFLLFCDDDNWLSKTYITDVYETMASNPTIGALGGNGEAEFELPPPEWIKRYSGTYATGPQGEKSGVLNKTFHVYGAGCTYRKSAIKRIQNDGFQFQLIGRKGKDLQAGDDHELCYALHLAGFQIHYKEELVFKHFIPKERINANYIKKNLRGFSNSSFILSIYKIAIGNKYHKRSKVKNSWLWVSGIKLLFTLKRVLNLLIKERNKNPLYFEEVKNELLSLKILLLNKTFYNTFLLQLLTSNWTTSNTNRRENS